MIDRIGGFNYDGFYKWIAENKTGKFVEIGSFRGGSTIFMAQHIKDVEFYTVDPFLPYEVEGQWLFPDYELFLQNITPYSEKINHLKMTSLEASKLFNDGELDFVFIDGAHDYENVKADIKAWMMKLKPDGILAGHDFCSDYPGVIQAVKEAGFNYTVIGDVWIKTNEVPLLGII